MTSRRTLHLPAALLLAALVTAVMFVVVASLASTKKADATHLGRGVLHPPKAVLMKAGKELQKGRVGTYCWSIKDQSGGCADTFRNYNDPRTTARVGAPSTLRIRIHYADQPDRFTLRWGHEVRGENFGHRIVKQSKPRPTQLRRVQKGGETVAWDVYFKVKRPGKHYYMNFQADFWDGKRGIASQWSFHVKTRRDS
jgi:hypothetical protein